MITKITIDRFKSIQHAELNLGRVNVLVGANNSGKSSILQAIQFATSVAQTSQFNALVPKFKSNNELATSVYPDQLIYSPVQDPYTLATGGVLKEDEAQAICVSFDDDNGNTVRAAFRKGKNKNISANFRGKEIGSKLLSLENPFCMYVPGLAGVPFEEEIRPIGIVRRISAKGDSNTVFRNVLYQLSTGENWEYFVQDIQSIFTGIQISIEAKAESDGHINVKFRFSEDAEFLPIDLAGTGVLQAIQIAAYVNYFKPQLLLLDEPDSHLHPDNQRLLASMMLQLAERDETTIIISTHSRHLMAALRDDAVFFLMKNGNVEASRFDHYIGLLELGAIDDYDRIKNGELRYAVLTEDGSPEGRRMLKNVIEASGFSDSEFKIFSYDGVSNIGQAKMFAQFLLDLNPDINVIIYRDRDGLYDDELTNIQRSLEFDTRVKCVIAKNNDIEMYYCEASHIMLILEAMGLAISEEQLSAIISEAMLEVKDASMEKLYTHRFDIARRERSDTGAAARIAAEKYNNNPQKFVCGKKLAKAISIRLQTNFRINIDIYKASNALKENGFEVIHTAA